MHLLCMYIRMFVCLFVCLYRVCWNRYSCGVRDVFLLAKVRASPLSSPDQDVSKEKVVVVRLTGRWNSHAGSSVRRRDPSGSFLRFVLLLGCNGKEREQRESRGENRTTNGIKNKVSLHVREDPIHPTNFVLFYVCW